MLKHETQWRNRSVSAPASHQVLIAEDSEADIYFLLRAFDHAKIGNAIHVVRDGDEVLSYLKAEGIYANRERYPAPRIVLLDLYMPSTSGFDILRWKKSQSQLKDVLFVALSNTNSVKDINLAYELGANTFLSKPLDGAEIRNLIEAFHDYWVVKHPKAAAESPATS